MDAVYILGKGSLSQNEEIRFSIRSLEQNMTDLRHIYIIGECPSFLQNVKHIPAEDTQKERHVNAYNKIKLACEQEEISDEFLLMNDDFFMLKPFEGSQFPFYALEKSNGGPCGQNSFHIHCPIRYQKEWFDKMPIDPDLKTCKSPRTFYANFYRAPVKFCKDFILQVEENAPDFDFQVAGNPCFSISDNAMLHPPFVGWLNELYPVPSRFEKL